MHFFSSPGNINASVSSAWHVKEVLWTQTHTSNKFLEQSHHPKITLKYVLLISCTLGEVIFKLDFVSTWKDP